mgnify:CR=1 FL=1
MGYRHIDTASAYGSEVAIGEALAEAFESGLVRREDMFITSKAWCSEMDDVLSAIKRTLRCFIGSFSFINFSYVILVEFPFISFHGGLVCFEQLFRNCTLLVHFLLSWFMVMQYAR